MSAQPFHHGNLRAVLLDQAEVVLRDRGLDALSLRELAREAGVSHGAPRSHFIDRNALLNALAERGFLRFAGQIGAAADHAPREYGEILRAGARASVAFAAGNGALLDLMFAAKMNAPPPELIEAAEGLFTTVRRVVAMGVELGAIPDGSVDRLTMLWSATMQGISALVVSQRVTGDESNALIDDAIALFLSGSLGS